MSDYLGGLYTALRERVLVAWPDTVTTYEAEHVSLLPWADLAGSVPYAVIVVNSLTSTGDYGMANDAFFAQVDLWRVQAVSGPTGTLLTQMSALRDDLLNNALSYGQVWPDPVALAWHDQLQPNQIFTSKGMLMRAGRLSITVLVGDAAG